MPEQHTFISIQLRKGRDLRGKFNRFLIQKSYVKLNVLVILHWFWNISNTCCKRRLVLHVWWDWRKTLRRELIKALLLVDAFSKAVHVQMMTDCMFPRINRIIFFMKYICIMTLFLGWYQSQEQKLPLPLYLAIALVLKALLCWEVTGSKSAEIILWEKSRLDSWKVFLIGL